jgi:hypothetical protein
LLEEIVHDHLLRALNQLRQSIIDSQIVLYGSKTKKVKVNH